MKKQDIKKIIYKNFKPRDVGIGLIDCISEEKQVEELANNLIEFFKKTLI